MHEGDLFYTMGQFGNIWFLGYLILSALLPADADPLEKADLYVTYVIQVAYADVQFCRLHCECISCNLILSALLTTDDDPRENEPANYICKKSVFYILAFIIGQLAVYRMTKWVLRKMMVFNTLNKDINKEITDGWDREAVRDMASGPQDEAVEKRRRCNSVPNIYTETGIPKHVLPFCTENSLGSQNPANSIGRNLLGGEWDRQKTFDENGGELRKARSAVTLLVPTGAINAKQVSTIYGKVFADLEKVSQVVKLWPNYRFISPVVEFISGGQTKYSKHLRIRIPIACKWNEKASVISFRGRGDYSLSEVPTLSKNKKTLPDMYYEKEEEGFINIFTRHFTAFACVSCDRQNMSLNGIVFGSRLYLDPQEVSLRFYLCDSLLAIPDILESLRREEEKQFGRLLLDLKPIKLIKPSPNDLLLVSIETSNKWKLKTKPDGSCLFPIYENTLADFHYCSSDRILYEWTYHRNSTLSKDGFGCCINAKVGNRRTTFDISIPVDERDTTRKFTGRFTEIEKLLTTLADHDKMRDIARHLEVDETKLKDLHKNNKGDTTGAKHAFFELCVNKHGSYFPEKLKAALKAMHENHLLETIFPKDLKIQTQV